MRRTGSDRARFGTIRTASARRARDRQHGRGDDLSRERGHGHDSNARGAPQVDDDPGHAHAEATADGRGVERASSVQQPGVKGADGHGHDSDRHRQNELEGQRARRRREERDGGREPAGDERHSGADGQRIAEERAGDLAESGGRCRFDVDEDGNDARILKYAREERAGE